MKFITISVAALSLASNVLSAPTANLGVAVLPAPFDTVEHVAGLDKKDELLSAGVAGLKVPVLEEVVRRDGPISDVLEIAADLPVLGGTPDIVGGLRKKSIDIITTLTSSIKVLQTHVQADVVILTDNLGPNVSTSVGPVVEHALEDIAIYLNATIVDILPDLSGSIIALALEEVESLLAVVQELELIVGTIADILLKLVDTLAADVLDLVKPEILIVLSLIQGLVPGVSQFAMGVAGTVTGSGSTEIIAKITTSVTSITNVTHTVMSPASGGSVVNALMQ